jgi:hypothetical protein
MTSILDKVLKNGKNMFLLMLFINIMLIMGHLSNNIQNISMFHQMVQFNLKVD